MGVAVVVFGYSGQEASTWLLNSSWLLQDTRFTFQVPLRTRLEKSVILSSTA